MLVKGPGESGRGLGCTNLILNYLLRRRLHIFSFRWHVGQIFFSVLGLLALAQTAIPNPEGSISFFCNPVALLLRWWIVQPDYPVASLYIPSTIGNGSYLQLYGLRVVYRVSSNQPPDVYGGERKVAHGL